jgi:dTDP-L-rhamnose 4-epimerase
MRERARFCHENITGTAVLCDLLAERPSVRRLVLASSRAVYGEGPYRCPRGCSVVERLGVTRGPSEFRRAAWDPVCPECGTVLQPLASREDSPLRPVSLYGTTKVVQEQLVEQTRLATGTPVTILRLQNVYGPGQQRAAPDVGVANILAQRALDGHGMALFEDGNPRRDYVYIDDVAELFVRAALGGITGEPLELFNVGSGCGTTLSRLVELIVAASGRPVDVSISGEYRIGDVRHAVADMRSLSERYPWRPIPLLDGIERLVQRLKTRP